MVAGWNLLTNDAAAKRKVREIRAGVTDDDDPIQVEVAFFDHTLDALPLGVEIEEDVPEGAVCLNVSIVAIPSGLHLPPEGAEGLRWHPTGVMMDGVPEVRQVPNLVTAEEAKALVGPPKPSRVDAGVVAESDTYRGLGDSAPEDDGEARVTAEEIAMARAEAKAMRDTPIKRDWEVEAFGNSRIVRKAERIDTSWLWGDSRETRVVRSQVMPERPVKD